VNTNYAIAGGGMYTPPQINQTALWVGFLLSLFTGIYGLSHLINGKVGGAISAFFLYSVIWPIVAGIIIMFTFGIGFFVVLPVHLWLCWSVNEQGAILG